VGSDLSVRQINGEVEKAVNRRCWGAASRHELSERKLNADEWRSDEVGLLLPPKLVRTCGSRSSLSRSGFLDRGGRRQDGPDEQDEAESPAPGTCLDDGSVSSVTPEAWERVTGVLRDPGSTACTRPAGAAGTGVGRLGMRVEDLLACDRSLAGRLWMGSSGTGKRGCQSGWVPRRSARAKTDRDPVTGGGSMGSDLSV
jgi:hypothetical protein